MENSIDLDLYSNDLTVSFNSTVYEDLDKQNNDRYEYILPEISVIKNFGNLDVLNGDFLIESNNLVRQYDTNILERQNINNFIFRSNPKINRFGLLNNYEFLIKNTNSHNENTNYKNKENFYLSGIFQHNSSLPLIAENNTYQKILKPKLIFKAAPNHTKDERNEERKIDITNVYSINRAVEKNTVEGGLSLAYGFDYSLLNKLKNKETLNFKIANNFRLKDNDDLTNSNQIGEKTSNVFSEIAYSPYNFFTAKYASSIKNNLKDIDNENLITEFKFDNFMTTFDYLNENNSLDKNSYISNTTSYSLDKFNSLKFSTRENKTKDLTEYYNFMYQYQNDCLAASIEYNKDFYSDRELQPDESILFKLTITPFAEVTSPNIKQ
jgi:LPS-assembly protein